MDSNLLQVNVDERIKLEDILSHPWMRGEVGVARCPAPEVGVAIPLRSGPPPGLGLNSVGSSHNSQSPGGLHPKLCRKTPHNLGVLGTTSGIKKTSKNAENNSILVSGDFPRLSHGHSQVSVMPSLQYSCIKDMKNEANEAVRSGVMEDNKVMEDIKVEAFTERLVAGGCRVKVERMEAGDNIHIISQASAYATL